MENKWNIKQSEKFVFLMQRNAILYNAQIKEYMEKLKRIAFEAKKNRDAGRNERRQEIRKSKSKLSRFDQLSSRPSVDNIDEVTVAEVLNSDSSTIASVENASNDGSNEPRPKKTKRSNELTNEFARKDIPAQTKDARSFAWLGTLVATQMEKIREEDREKVALQILAILKKYKTNSQRKGATSTASTTPGSTSSSSSGNSNKKP